MKEFDELVSIIDRLMAPNGCPWDREQTLMSMRTSLMEEICELIEAIDLQDSAKIKEELGDCFFNAVFLCRLAEKEGKFNIQELLSSLREKLIRRHPHVFGEFRAENTEEALKHWEQVKKSEKTTDASKNILDDIPKGLPALTLAQKILKRMGKAEFAEVSELKDSGKATDEETLGKALLELANEAQKNGLDAEQALRNTLAQMEHRFRCGK
jgi:tetrapyrrole methylase family protein / MazG family protein